MFGGKAKEVQLALEEREDELKKLRETLRQRETENATMRTQMEGYQKDREAVISALTEAQETARRIITQARMRSEDMIREAEEKTRALREQHDGIIAEAESRAQEIVERAQACAKESEARSAAKASEAEAHAKKFREYVKHTADNIKRQAEEYAEFLSGAAGTAVEGTLDLPEDYKNPAELMKSIFAIQGRDIPVAEPEKVETAAAPVEEAAPTEQAAPVAEAKGELNLIQGYAEPETQGDKLWTVDEVMQEGEPAQSSVDDDLNAIIGDVLKLD